VPECARPSRRISTHRSCHRDTRRAAHHPHRRSVGSHSGTAGAGRTGLTFRSLSLCKHVPFRSVHALPERTMSARRSCCDRTSRSSGAFTSMPDPLAMPLVCAAGSLNLSALPADCHRAGCAVRPDAQSRRIASRPCRTRTHHLMRSRVSRSVDFTETHPSAHHRAGDTSDIRSWPNATSC
jgi:hypothetical protein